MRRTNDAPIDAPTTLDLLTKLVMARLFRIDGQDSAYPVFQAIASENRNPKSLLMLLTATTALSVELARVLAVFSGEAPEQITLRLIERYRQRLEDSPTRAGDQRS